MVYLLTFLPGQLASIQQRRRKSGMALRANRNPPSGLGSSSGGTKPRDRIDGRILESMGGGLWVTNPTQYHRSDSTRHFEPASIGVLAAGALLDAAVLAKVLLFPERILHTVLSECGNRGTKQDRRCIRHPRGVRAVPVLVTRRTVRSRPREFTGCGCSSEGRREHAWKSSQTGVCDMSTSCWNWRDGRSSKCLHGCRLMIGSPPDRDCVQRRWLSTIVLNIPISESACPLECTWVAKHPAINA